TAELYDPESGSWVTTGSLNTGRFDHTANLLPNGKALVAGGEGAALASAELYDPASGTWVTTSSLNTGRYRHTATLLLSDKILLAGGENGGGATASAELGGRRRRTEEHRRNFRGVATTPRHGPFLSR